MTHRGVDVFLNSITNQPTKVCFFVFITGSRCKPSSSKYLLFFYLCSPSDAKIRRLHLLRNGDLPGASLQTGAGMYKLDQCLSSGSSINMKYNCHLGLSLYT